MSYSVENLLNDAIKLSRNLKECEIESDNLIYQSVNLNKDNENITEYTEDMSALTNKYMRQSRKSLIASIQCESKKIKQLEAENLELKSTLQDYELVMKLMSQKYRNHVSKLISHMNIENMNNVINSNYKQKIDEQSQKIEEQSRKIGNLVEFIQKIMNLDIQNFLDIQKSLTRLEFENEGLRQILGISKDHHNFKSRRSTSEIAVQTELNDLNCVDVSFNDKMGNLNISIDMDISSDVNNTKRLKDLKEINLKEEKINCATIKKVIKDDHFKYNEQIKP